MKLTGVYPPLITPATATDDVDTDTLATHVTTLAAAGVDGFFPCGTVGEFTSLTNEHRSTAIRTVVEHADGKPVLAGCGGNSVADVVTQIETAAAAGADVAVVITPYYLETDDAGVERFFETVLERSPLPVLIYTIPFLTHTPISVESVRRLAASDRVVGIKDSSGDARFHSRLNAETDEEFTVLQGITDHAIISVAGGSDGLIPGVANVAPKALVEVYEATRAGNYDRALELHTTVIDPLRYAFDGSSLTAGLKYALRERGLDVGGPFPPLTALSDDEQVRISDRLADVPEKFLYRV
ncbi:dihydrodipicolinate synthase family protein [Natrononativus amylolyticus]|uniref:dihydrodipicolinate synthase family protein n=1 Tax=Natrononativus amylolyticus TaxID=2963434 RepID=UPI0020CCC1BE|nr:dihydrodipicolinate synthase family protein [Natrononativus amylolyticus]